MAPKRKNRSSSTINITMQTVTVPVHGVDDGSVLFSIFKPPVPMPRPRWTFAPGRGGRGRMSNRGRPFNPAARQMTEWRAIIVALLFQDGATRPMFLRDQSVEVSITFRFKRPVSHFKPNGKLRTGAPSRPPGDLDNYIKFILDIMNKLVYDDDVQVVSLRTTKIYDADPSVTTQVKPIYLR
jgi:Holliday junction resolvase RusA-like endonuclease